MGIFNLSKKKPVKQMNQFSMLIYNELNYITSYCINQNIDINNCDQDLLAVLSENIGMIYLGAAITYLQHYGLIKEKDELIKDFEPYTKQLYGRRQVDEFRNFCMNDETEKVYHELEEFVNI